MTPSTHPPAHSPFLQGLNPKQLEAVTLPPEPALILAGAGSGKTRVLTTRIAWLIATGQTSPLGVLAVTFTNKAAREMMGRLSAMLPINLKGMWVGTFHGLCNRLLRAHHKDAALPATFQILDSQDQLAAIKRLMKSVGENPENDAQKPKELQRFINGFKERGMRPQAITSADSYNQKFIELYQLYEDQCQREGVVDFGELLLRSVELLSRNTALRDHYRSRFQHVLVDEFQDTNPLQYLWLKALSTPETGLFAVGDDDQSIYAFRGADVANMRRFEREFAVQHLIKLEQNYRSHGHILEAANQLIANNQGRMGKNLWTDAGVGDPIRVMEAPSDLMESSFIVEDIRALIQEGYSRDEIAILYRSNAQSRVIEQSLFNAGIAYKVYGGLRFFERAEIKHALAYLRLMENPHEDTAFLRVVNFPMRGIGARSIEMLADEAKRQGSSLYTASGLLDGKAGTAIRGFVQTIESLRFETQGLTLPRLVETMLERSQLIAHYEKDREGRERIENLRELITAAAAFMVELGQPADFPATAQADADTMSPLAAFLSHASLEAGDNQAGEGERAVQLMTVHAAKGLEFKAVYVTGLEEGLFPHQQSADDPDGLEEERRLMYVAITRARERLSISLAQTRMLHGQTRYNMRSRFLDELPEGCLKWLSPKRSHRSVVGEAWDTPRMGGYSAGGGHPPAHLGNAGFGTVGVARPPALASAKGHESGFAVGQRVGHARFGEGVVTGFEGAGPDAKIQVSFRQAGSKWLALSVVKLEAL